MRAVGIQELRTHLDDYVRLVQEGEQVQVTRGGTVVIELRLPECRGGVEGLPPGLLEMARRGTAHQVERNDPSVYPRLERVLEHTSVRELLDQERSDRR